MKLTIQKFSKNDFLEYKKWFEYESISSALGFVDQEWLEFVLNTEGFTQISIFKENILIAVCGIYLPTAEYKYYAISDFSVNPNFQKLGIGSIVLSEIIYNFEFNNYSTWKALINNLNISAIEFFKKNGWKYDELYEDEYSSYVFERN